jgi:hypothetical protein
MMQPTFAKRRTVLLGAWAAAALGFAGVAFPQQKKPLLIGWLHSGLHRADGHYLSAFKEGMTALGWKDETTFIVEERWEARPERRVALAEEVASRAIVEGESTWVQKQP